MNGETASYEERLIADFKEGSRERFDELVKAYTQKLYRLAYGLLGNHHDAEEVVQDSFVRAYRGLDSFRGDSSFETWMHRITMNLARNKFHWNRRRGEGMTMSLSDLPESLEDGEPAGEMDLPDTSYSPDLLMQKAELHLIRLEDITQSEAREALTMRTLSVRLSASPLVKRDIMLFVIPLLIWLRAHSVLSELINIKWQSLLLQWREVCMTVVF